MKQLLIFILLFVSLVSFGATLRQRINKEKITLVTVESIQQAQAQAQAIVDQDEQFVKKRLGITKYLIPKNEKLFEVSLAKFSRTFTVLIPKGQKKSFNTFQRKIDFNQTTVFILEDVDIDKDSTIGFTTFSVTPNKDMLKKLIEQHNAKFQKPKEQKKDQNKKSNSNPFGFKN